MKTTHTNVTEHAGRKKYSFTFVNKAFSPTNYLHISPHAPIDEKTTNFLPCLTLVSLHIQHPDTLKHTARKHTQLKQQQSVLHSQFCFLFSSVVIFLFLQDSILFSSFCTLFQELEHAGRFLRLVDSAYAPNSE